MNVRTSGILLALALVLAVATTVAWYQSHEALRAARAQFVTGTLESIESHLKENQTIISELQAEPYTEKDNGVLESYLVKIRRDGVVKNAPMKQRLDQLAENNTALVTLIMGYSPHAKTAAFTLEANKFRNYASAWRDRWNSVMELFMAGGNYAAAEVPFPSRFPEAVQAEIAAAK